MYATRTPIATNRPMNDSNVTVLVSNPVVFMFARFCNPTGNTADTTSKDTTIMIILPIEIAN